LLDRSAEAVHQPAVGGGTAMHLAAFQGYSDCVELLLHAGGDANAKVRWRIVYGVYTCVCSGGAAC
jgi:ankyrin repeat protein